MTSIKSYIAFATPLYCGLAYILGIVYFAGITGLISVNSVQEKINIFANNYVSMFIVTNLIYVVFGFMIAVLSFLIYDLLKKGLFNKVGLAIGLFWSFAVILAGIVFNTGMKKVLEINLVDSNFAIQIWTIVDIIFDSIGGGTEILGGVWILIISILALREKTFNYYINIMGIIIGISGILSHIPSLEVFQMVFGLLQITWFFAIAYPLYKIYKTKK